MRIIRFYHRFKNQYRIHGHWAKITDIIKWAWKQSEKRKTEEVSYTKVDIAKILK